MALSEIENQLGAGHVVLRYARGRTVVFAAIILALDLGYLFVLGRTFWRYSFEFYGLIGGALVYTAPVLFVAALAYGSFVIVVQAVRGIPLLQTSEGGIAINGPWGPMFVPWRDAAEFAAGFGSVKIRLHEGARPDAPTWRRIAYGLWARTISVSTVSTVAGPTDIAEGLSTLRARYGAT